MGQARRRAARDTRGPRPRRRPELRALIEEHRHRDAFTLTGLTIQIDQLRTSMEALATKARRHEELIRRISRHP